METIRELTTKGQRVLCAKRGWMRGAEDTPSPLDHVLPDALDFEQIVACVERPSTPRRSELIQTQVVAGVLGVVKEGISKVTVENER